MFLLEGTIKSPSRLIVRLTARETDPEDAAHKLRRKVEQKRIQHRPWSLSPDCRVLHNADSVSLKQLSTILHLKEEETKLTTSCIIIILYFIVLY